MQEGYLHPTPRLGTLKRKSDCASWSICHVLANRGGECNTEDRQYAKRRVKVIRDKAVTLHKVGITTETCRNPISASTGIFPAVL